MPWRRIVGEGGLTRRQIQYGDLVEAELSRVFVNEPQLEEFRQLRVFVSKAVVSPDLRVAKVYWGCWEPRDTDAAEKRILARQKQIQYLFAKQVEQYVGYRHHGVCYRVDLVLTCGCGTVSSIHRRLYSHGETTRTTSASHSSSE